MLFDDFNRTNASRKSSRESNYAFLNRSSRPEIARVRDFLEQLARQYPPDERAELISRIKSGSSIHFRSASFELLLYSFLLALGYALSPHPQLKNGSSKRPDFLVTTPGGDKFYLEAVLASTKDGQDPSAQARISTTLDALSKGSHPNFFVSVRTVGAPTTQPSGNRLLTEVLKWLDTLDPNAVEINLKNCGRTDREIFRWSHEDWDIELEAIPVSPEHRGKTTTLIGIQHGGAGFIDEWTPIRDAVKLKGSRYGELDQPLVVAVNMDSFHLERIDEMQALYGQEQFTVAIGQYQSEPTFSRAPNGAWHGKGGPQSTQVSGAWIFADLSPYTIASRRQTIYVNPWAKRALPGDLMQLPHAVLMADKMVWHEGISLREAFALDEQWPE